MFLTNHPLFNTTVANYTDDKAIISINNYYLTASTNLKNHLICMENFLTKWRFKVNQTKSIHTTFTLRQTPCLIVFLYGTFIL